MDYVYVYIQVFPTGFYKYIQGQTFEGLRKSARAAHILRHHWQPIKVPAEEGIETDHNTGITTLLFARVCGFF